MSVSDLLADSTLGLVGVHLPHPTGDVRWVATSELVDPTPFLEGGEVLLTTGLETRGWRTQWRGYVERLHAARVAALGLGTGLTHRQVPAGLVRACEQTGLNLFEVPRRTTFVAISRAASRLIDRGADAAARRSLEIQRQLTQAALRPDARERLLDRLAEVLAGAAALVARDGRVVIGPTGPRAGSMDVGAVADEVARIAPKGLRAAVSAHAAGATSIVQPVGLQGRPSGYLAVLVPGRADDLHRVAVGTAVSLLGLVTESDRQRREVLRPLRSRALELLVHADSRTAAIVLAASGDPTPALPERLVVVRARSAGGDLDEALAAAEESVPLVGRVHDELWVVSTPTLVARHAATLAGLGLLVGVGDGVRRDEAGSSHANAGHALATATPPTPVVWWERLVGEGAMGALDRERATAFAESFLAGVSEEDRTLLRVFLGHHGSRLKAAEELGVHRNTVRNRLAHVESVLGRTFDDPQARVDAWVALQLTS